MSENFKEHDRLRLKNHCKPIYEKKVHDLEVVFDAWQPECAGRFKGRWFGEAHQNSFNSSHFELKPQEELNPRRVCVRCGTRNHPAAYIDIDEGRVCTACHSTRCDDPQFNFAKEEIGSQWIMRDGTIVAFHSISKDNGTHKYCFKKAGNEEDFWYTDAAGRFGIDSAMRLNDIVRRSENAFAGAKDFSVIPNPYQLTAIQDPSEIKTEGSPIVPHIADGLIEENIEFRKKNCLERVFSSIDYISKIDKRLALEVAEKTQSLLAKKIATLKTKEASGRKQHVPQSKFMMGDW